MLIQRDRFICPAFCVITSVSINIDAEFAFALNIYCLLSLFVFLVSNASHSPITLSMIDTMQI